MNDTDCSIKLNPANTNCVFYVKGTFYEQERIQKYISKRNPCTQLTQCYPGGQDTSAQNKDQHKLEAVKIQAEGHEERLQKMIRMHLK